MKREIELLPVRAMGRWCRVLRHALCAAAASGWVVASLMADEEPLVQHLTVTGPRLSGPVSVSLQNELDAAISRGRIWLLSRQQPDGSWATPEATSLATLALLSGTLPDERRAACRGAVWLHNAPSVAATTRESSRWRVCALRQAAAVFTNLPPLEPGDSPVLPDVALPLPPGPPSMRLVHLAALWTNVVSGSEAVSGPRLWWGLSRWINRDGKGSLADVQGRLIDWRNDLGQRLVSTQRIDPSGHGAFWDGPGGDGDASRVVETAFALLAIGEL